MDDPNVTVPSGAGLTILSNTLVLMDGVTSGTSANDLLLSGRCMRILNPGLVVTPRGVATAESIASAAGVW